MFSFYGQSFCLVIIFRRFDQHIPIRPFPPPYMIGYYAGPFAFKTTSCIATQVTDPTLDYCTNLIAFSLLGKGVCHILEWLSNSIISADKKIPRLQADCPVKLYKSHFWLPTMLAYTNLSKVECLTSFLLVIQPAGLSLSCREHHYHLFNMGLWSHSSEAILIFQ